MLATCALDSVMDGFRVGVWSGRFGRYIPKHLVVTVLLLLSAVSMRAAEAPEIRPQWNKVTGLVKSTLSIRPIASRLPAFAVVTGAVGLEKYVRSRTPLWVTELGNSSYSLYLTHGLLIPFLVVILRKIQLTGHFATLLFLVLGTLVCLAVGELFYRWFELPMMRFLRSARHREPRLLQGLDGAKAETM